MNPSPVKFLIVTHVTHTHNNGKYYAYGPYVREMNLWTKNAQHVIIVAPLVKSENINAIDIAYEHERITFMNVPAFQFTSALSILKALFVVPYIVMALFIAMIRSNHIHLRCPGNMGLLGTLTQLLFPLKKKTAKYAGNWDWKSNQPFTYRLQQRILRNTWFTHNMQTLVYGEWPDKTKNILPFFTASYSEKDLLPISPKNLTPNSIVKLMFVGALANGKNPIQSLTVAYNLLQQNIPTEIHFYGEGILRQELEDKIAEYNMTNTAFVHGNVNSNELKEAYRQCHFMILLSDSEGWPKAVAEAMWWGCVPVTTPVSCVSWMLQYGERGLIIPGMNTSVTDSISALFRNSDSYQEMSTKASNWARLYTLERFEREITNIIAK